MHRRFPPLGRLLLAAVLLWTQTTLSYGSIVGGDLKTDAFGYPLCLTSNTDQALHDPLACCFLCCFSSQIVGPPASFGHAIKLGRVAVNWSGTIHTSGPRVSYKNYPNLRRAPPILRHAVSYCAADTLGGDNPIFQ